MIKYKKGIRDREIWKCKYVQEKQAGIVVRLTPSIANKTLLVSREEDMGLDPSIAQPEQCETRIYFYEDPKESDYFFRCESDTEPSLTKSNTFNCDSADSCANLYRRVRTRVCTFQ